MPANQSSKIESSVSNQIMEQQVDFIVVSNNIVNPDTSAVSLASDSVYLFYQPEVLSASDSLYQELINPLTIKIKPSGEYGFIPKAKADFIPNWTIILIIILFAILAAIRSASENYVVQLFQSLFDRKSATKLFKEKVSTLMSVTFRLDTFFILTTGSFIYQLADHFIGFDDNERFLYLGLCIVALFLYINLKYSLYLLSGAIFDTKDETREYIFHAKTGNRIMAIILFPIVLSLFIAQGEFAEFLVFFGLGIVAIMLVIKTLRSMLLIAQKVFSFYYLILYLCTLEILPLLLMGKFLMNV